MNVNTYISALAQYGLNKGFFESCDKTFIINQLLSSLKLDYYEAADSGNLPLEEILRGILDDAVNRGVIPNDNANRDLLDTRLMGILTPPPREVQRGFFSRYARSPEEATDWFYRFSQDTDYIRRYRSQHDIRWKTATKYGNMDITINLSKPEKDPKSIAAAKEILQSGYPKCQLCMENEGYAGDISHPARQNHRVIPLRLAGSDWYLQYSPYVYYREHCIVFSATHEPMAIDKATFQKLLDFVALFPHYFIGSNADLPIVGGSILAHEHFQGGRHTFPMEMAPVERPVFFHSYPEIKAGIVKWPMSVIRLTSSDKGHLIELASRILHAWRGYTDEAACILAETDGIPHNTITPIARRKNADYVLDLVLRNNITTKEHPLGLFHPHKELHHIKKENIGLIEVMGLAVLPARLKEELQGLREVILSDGQPSGSLCKHALWLDALRSKYTFTSENISCILKMEIGRLFEKMLEQAGVFKRIPEGMRAFDRFIDYVNRKD